MVRIHSGLPYLSSTYSGCVILTVHSKGHTFFLSSFFLSISSRLRCQDAPGEHLLDDLALRPPDFFVDRSRIQFQSDATVGVTHHVLRRLHVVVYCPPAGSRSYAGSNAK